ncbi:glycosyltransferase [Methylobacterium sp. E-045]|uniref:glycosyltransferase n=1 Tax=Methylobacterium sp. E-045 TaxID=2836575 RepID=UPI001FBBAB55|nr:glycosyltransferase family A protein [Methylobacterium sp. E-045]MCJ2132194.1 glycosyltransferase family 2 protein [Methylobacterium sp. E-045]
MIERPASSARRRYALISPSRDEAGTMRRTLDSLLIQTVPPAHLVFVDDGSTDDTQAILAEYAPRMPYLHVVSRPDRGVRKVGPGVIEAFNAGLAELDLSQVEFLCKLDMDLDLPARYFETLMDRMDADPMIATCSGKPFFPDPSTGVLISEHIADEFSVGMTKFYRVSAWLAIGGFPISIGWDGIDCHLCRMQGMKAISFPDPELDFVHLRPMGSSHISLWHGRTRHGLGAWVMGTPPVFMLAATLYRMNKRPRVVGAVAMLWGYLKAWAGGVKRFDAPGYLAFVRSYQLRALVIGRGRAAEQMRLRQPLSLRALLRRPVDDTGEHAGG